jgi:hypothetical protein
VGVKAINYSYNLNYKKYAKLEKVKTDVGQIYIYIYLIIVGFRYFKIKNSKNCPSLVLLFFRDEKNRLGLDLKNPKRGDYEVGVRVKVHD